MERTGWLWMTPSEKDARRREVLGPDFDQHESGQLRLGAAGDQLEVLPLEDGRVPVSDGGRLASPALENEQRFRDWLTRHGEGGTLG